MSNVVEVDASTGTVTVREFTEDEAAQRAADQAAAAAAKDAAAAEQAQREAARARLLARLGLTADEAVILLTPPPDGPLVT